MLRIVHFITELDELFGFYFDCTIAAHFALERLSNLQTERDLPDSAHAIYGDTAPSEPPEVEARRGPLATTFGHLKDRLSPRGFNIQRAAEATIILTYHVWDERYRSNCVKKDGRPIGKINSDIFGDLRLIRNSIIHNKGVATPDVERCKIFKKFTTGDRIILTDEDMFSILRSIKSDLQQYDL